MDKEMRVAVLIDAENISSKYASTILQEASSLGNIIYKRIYGNWTTPVLSSWKKQLLENAIQPIQQYSNTTGKNSSDSALIIDAMDLLYQKRLDAFCIVSSDSDFTRLASRLREDEMFVLGMGEQKTPRSFISACNKFSYLDLLYKDRSATSEKKKKKRSKTQSNTQPVDTPKHAPTKTTEELALTEDASETFSSTDWGDGSSIEVVTETLRELSEEFCGDDGWILSARLGGLLLKRLPDFDTRNFGFKKFVPFIESLRTFESKTITSEGDQGVKTIYFRLIEE